MTAANDFAIRRMFQFRLRTLLGLMLVASGLMGWCYYHFQSYRKQWFAYEQIAEKAQYSSTAPGRPAWLTFIADRKTYHDIARLSFHQSSHVNDDDLVHLGQMPRLTRLSLHQTGVTDRGLAHLEHLTELTSLSLKHTAVSDQGLAHLHQLNNLRDLRLSGTKITSSGLALLKNHPQLEHLELARLNVRDDDLIHLTALSKLKYVDLSESQITGDGLTHLASLSQLQTLKLSSDRLRRVVLADMPNLAEIDIYGRRSFALVWLARMDSLIKLSIRKPNYGRRNLETAVADAPPLTSLKLPTTTLRGLHLSNLPALAALDLDRLHLHRLTLDQLPNVQRLSLVGAVLTDALIKQASHLPGLTEVRLQNARPGKVQTPRKTRAITAADLAFLRTASRLKSVNLFATRLAPNALSVLHGHPQLQTLVLGRCRLTDSSLSDLADLQNLRHLDLQDNPITGTGLRHLVQSRNLEHLQVNRTLMNNQGAAHLASLTSLRVLDLRNTKITNQSLMHFHCLTDLRSLSLPRGLDNDARQRLRDSLLDALVTPYSKPRILLR